MIEKTQQKELECLRCGYNWNSLTEPEKVKVCPRCKSYQFRMPRIRAKKESVWDNENKKEESYNPFKGERYKDYDFEDLKKLHFGKKKFSKCSKCGKKLDFDNSYYGYNRLFCKECYKEFSINSFSEVEKVTKEI